MDKLPKDNFKPSLLSACEVRDAYLQSGRTPSCILKLRVGPADWRLSIAKDKFFLATKKIVCSSSPKHCELVMVLPS